MALQTGVAMAVELIMAHPVAMETGGPVAYVRVQEWFIILGYSEIRGVRGSWVIRDVDIGGKCGVLRSEVVQEGVNLGNSGSQTQLGASSKEGMVEVDVTVLEKNEKSVYFLVVRDMFDERDEGIPHGHVVGVSFANEANGRLGVDSTV